MGVDVGGTFTDIVLVEGGIPAVQAKSLSTPDDPSVGVFDALATAAEEFGSDVKGLLSSCEMFVVGTTVATNALLEHHGASCGLVCTAGFRDDLAIRRGAIPRDHDFRDPFPVDLVPRRRRLGVRGRIDKHGDIVVELNEDDVRAALDVLRKEGIDSLAVCLFNSFLNPAHERRVRELAREAIPNVSISLSSDVLPVIGEYPRVSTTVVNAYVAPRTVNWLHSLESQMSQLSFSGRLCVMQNNGGIVEPRLARGRPVLLLMSGPAAGAPGTEVIPRNQAHELSILFDMGGTSTDITILRDRSPLMSRETRVAGYDVMTPAVDVHTVAAGGGAIVHLDEGGLLRIGPRSAGAVPGPVCLGRGGTEPTVTDANLILGRIDPEKYAGGEIPLYPELAWSAFERLGLAAGRSATATAHGAVRVAEEMMAQAIRVHCLRKGVDARDGVLISAGGAGGLHAAAVAEILGMARVIVPHTAPVFCAMGMLHAPLRRDFVTACFQQLDASSPTELNVRLRELRATADEEVIPSSWPGRVTYDYSLAMQYAGQMFQIDVPVPAQLEDGGEEAVREAFHRHHASLYGHSHPDAAIDVVRATLTVTGDPVRLAPHANGAGPSEPPPSQQREVWLAADEPDTSDIYRAASMAPGTSIAGPAVIESPNSAVLVPPGSVATCDKAGNLAIHLTGEL